MSWRILSFHFRQSYDGGYRYLDRCGEFMVSAQQKLDFIPSESKPTGCKMELPEQGISLAVDTIALALTQELNPDAELFIRMCEESSRLAQELFEPIKIVRTGFAVRYRVDFSTEEAMNSALQKMVSESHLKLGQAVGMTPHHENLDYWFTAGSRQLHLTCQASSLHRTEQSPGRPGPMVNTLDKKRFQRRTEFHTAFGDELKYGLVLEVDLMEDDPPSDASLSGQFAQTRKIADISKERLSI